MISLFALNYCTEVWAERQHYLPQLIRSSSKMCNLSVPFLLSALVLLSINCIAAATLGRSADTPSSYVTMNYSFLPKKEQGRGCFAKQSVWTTSTFTFDPSEKGRSLMLNETTRDLQLRISCVASEPLRWIVNTQVPPYIMSSKYNSSLTLCKIITEPCYLNLHRAA